MMLTTIELNPETNAIGATLLFILVNSVFLLPLVHFTTLILLYHYLYEDDSMTLFGMFRV